MDGLAAAVICREWKQRFERARIDKIHQPKEREIVLTVRAQGATTRLLLSADRSTARAHEIRLERPVNPAEPPRFCMFLRKRLEGGRIVDVHQDGIDRVLCLQIENLDEIGDLTNYLLILEIMGKHSNLLLCTSSPDGQPEKVLDSIVHVTPTMSRVRPVLPGLAYKPVPPQSKQPIGALSSQDFEPLCLSDLAPEDQAKAICRVVAGIGRLTAAEAIARSSARVTPNYADAVFTALQDLIERTSTGKETASLGLDELGRKVSAAPFLLTSSRAVKTSTDYNSALELLYADLDTSTRSTVRAADLVRAVEAQIDKLSGKRVRLEREQTQSSEHELLRMQAELLTAYPHLVKKGMTSVELPNFYDDERPLVIQLDPALTAIENAQKYFKQSSRRKRSIPILVHEIEETSKDLRYLSEIIVALHDATAAQVDALYEELADEGFIKRKRRKRQDSHQASRKKQKPAQADTYASRDGTRIRVGRGPAQNDTLTLRKSQPMDIWLHVKGGPGSHVVIDTSKGDVSDIALEDAALLASYFSKARDSANVPVDYTKIKHVWKPNGARPGFVLYEGQKTIYITPDRTLVEPILKTLRK